MEIAIIRHRSVSHIPSFPHILHNNDEFYFHCFFIHGIIRWQWQERQSQRNSNPARYNKQEQSVKRTLRKNNSNCKVRSSTCYYYYKYKRRRQVQSVDQRRVGSFKQLSAVVNARLRRCRKRVIIIDVIVMFATIIARMILIRYYRFGGIHRAKYAGHQITKYRARLHTS